jgi:DNA polymerase-3 subunit alpha
MKKLFTDLPESISNLSEIVDKIEIYDLAREVLLPKFDIQMSSMWRKTLLTEECEGKNAYLRHLT